MGDVRGRELVVRRDRIGEGHVRDATWALGTGELLVRVGTVGLTANNVTYAVLGEELRYWRAYPIRRSKRRTGASRCAAYRPHAKVP